MLILVMSMGAKIVFVRKDNSLSRYNVTTSRRIWKSLFCKWRIDDEKMNDDESRTCAVFES
jgi:hypothetical protein